MSQQLYYYKSKDGKQWLETKASDFDSDSNFERITKAEWDAHVAEVGATFPSIPTDEDYAYQVKLRRIAFLKGELARTDYQAIKYSEGWISADDYADVKAQRQAWRDEINQLESEL